MTVYGIAAPASIQPWVTAPAGGFLTCFLSGSYVEVAFGPLPEGLVEAGDIGTLHGGKVVSVGVQCDLDVLVGEHALDGLGVGCEFGEHHGRQCVPEVVEPYPRQSGAPKEGLEVLGGEVRGIYVGAVAGGEDQVTEVVAAGPLHPRDAPTVAGGQPLPLLLLALTPEGTDAHPGKLHLPYSISDYPSLAQCQPAFSVAWYPIAPIRRLECMLRVPPHRKPTSLDVAPLAIARRAVELARSLKVTRGRKLRTDATVLETNIHHPTDDTLLSDGVRVIGRLLKRAKGFVEESIQKEQKGEPFRDRARSAKRLAYKKIGRMALRRTEEAKAGYRTAYQRLVEVAKAST